MGEEGDFGIGLHYAYDWLNTYQTDNHVVGLDIYPFDPDDFPCVLTLTAMLPADHEANHRATIYGLNLGFGGMIDP